METRQRLLSKLAVAGDPLEDSHSFTLHLCTLFRAVVLQSSFALYRRAWFKNQIPGAILHA